MRRNNNRNTFTAKVFFLTKTLFLIFFFSLSINTLNSYAQFPDKKSDKESPNALFKLKLQGIITSNETSTSYYTYGYGITPNVQYKMGSVVSLYTELTVSRMKYVVKENTSSSSQTLSESMKYSFLISVGTKIYPFGNDAPGYAKLGFGLLSRTASKNYGESIKIPPVVKFGIGYEIPLSKIFSVFPEFETNLIGKSADFSLGAGVTYIQ